MCGSIVVVTDSDGSILDILTSDEAAKRLVGQELGHLSFTVSDLSSKDTSRHLVDLTFPIPVKDKEMLLGLFNQEQYAILGYANLL